MPSPARQEDRCVLHQAAEAADRIKGSFGGPAVLTEALSNDSGGPAEVRPWFDGSDPADPPAAKTAKHPTIVAPPLYDR